MWAECATSAAEARLDCFSSEKKCVIFWDWFLNIFGYKSNTKHYVGRRCNKCWRRLRQDATVRSELLFSPPESPRCSSLHPRSPPGSNGGITHPGGGEPVWSGFPTNQGKTRLSVPSYYSPHRRACDAAVCTPGETPSLRRGAMGI